MAAHRTHRATWLVLAGLVAAGLIACNAPAKKTSPPPATANNSGMASTAPGPGHIDTSTGLPPSIDVYNPPTNTGEGVSGNGSMRPLVYDGNGSDEPVVIYNEAASKLPLLFTGLTTAIERERFRTQIEIPAVRIVTPQINDRGRTWIRQELLANRGALIDAIADWTRRAVTHLATRDGLAEVTENRMIDDLARQLDLQTMGEAEGREVGRLAAAQAVVLIEIEPEFVAQRPINMYGSRYLVQAEYRATARMVNVERGVSVWFNSIAWSRAFEVTSR